MVSTKEELQEYVDTHIKENGQKSITGSKLKTFLTNLLDSISFGSSGPIVVTLAEAQDLITDSELKPGQVYKITGCYKDNDGSVKPSRLYNDGTDSGTTIYLTAITANKFSKSGVGEFFNPKYRVSSANYDNLDKTGTHGIWNGQSILGNNSVYAIDDVVFWGGYAWKNLTGALGTADDLFNLDAVNWVKLPYTDATAYDKVYDAVEYDVVDDYLYRRRNFEHNIDVKTTKDEYYNMVGYDHPVIAIPFGLYKIGNNEGMNDVYIEDSYCEFINFMGKNFYNISVKGFSAIYETKFNRGCVLYGIDIKDWSWNEGVELEAATGSQVQFTDIKIFNGGYINGIVFSGVGVRGLVIDDGTLAINGGDATSNVHSIDIKRGILSMSPLVNSTVSFVSVNDSAIQNLNATNSLLNHVSLRQSAQLDGLTLNTASFFAVSLSDDSHWLSTTIQNTDVSNIRLENGTLFQFIDLSAASHFKRVTATNGSFIDKIVANNSPINDIFLNRAKLYLGNIIDAVFSDISMKSCNMNYPTGTYPFVDDMIGVDLKGWARDTNTISPASFQQGSLIMWQPDNTAAKVIALNNAGALVVI